MAKFRVFQLNSPLTVILPAVISECTARHRTYASPAKGSKLTTSLYNASCFVWLDWAGLGGHATVCRCTYLQPIVGLEPDALHHCRDTRSFATVPRRIACARLENRFLRGNDLLSLGKLLALLHPRVAYAL